MYQGVAVVYFPVFETATMVVQSITLSSVSVPHRVLNNGPRSDWIEIEFFEEPSKTNKLTDGL